MKVGLVGCGFVGGALRDVLRYQHELAIYDPRMPALETFEQAAAAEVVFACVPTPAGEGGACDTSVLEGALHGLAERCAPGTPCVVKSTVPPGFLARVDAELPGALELVHAPEFLTQRIARQDFAAQRRVVLGTRAGLPCAALAALFGASLPGAELRWCRWDEAALAKYALNGSGAVLVSWWNELAQVADALGVDFDQVRRLVLGDGRLGATWSQVPGPDGLPGFGGACLGKDVAALASLASSSGVQPTMARAALAKNREIRRG